MDPLGRQIVRGGVVVAAVFGVVALGVVGATGFNTRSILVATLGAIILLALYRAIAGLRPSRDTIHRTAERDHLKTLKRPHRRPYEPSPCPLYPTG